MAEENAEPQVDETVTDGEAFYGEDEKEPEVKAEAEESGDKTEEPAKEKSESDDKEKETEEPEKVEGKEASADFKIDDLVIAEDSTVAKDEVERIAEIVKKQGLSKDVAQMIIDEKESSYQTYVGKQQEVLDAKIAEWKQETESDKEVGGDNMPQTIEKANLFLSKFGTPELNKLLKEGYGNHKEVLRVFSRAGATMQPEDEVLSGRNTQVNDKPTEDYFYT